MVKHLTVRKNWLKNVALGLILAAPAIALAQGQAITTGNALLTSQALERIVRKEVALKLDGSFFKNELQLSTPEMNEKIDFDNPTPLFQDIINTLHLEKPLRISIAPLHIKLDFPQSALKLDVKKISPGKFQVMAHVEVTNFSARSDSLDVLVPKGFFDQPFRISTAPKVGLALHSVPVKIDLELMAYLSDAGTKIELTSLVTNLNAKSKPEFSLKLSTLKVNGEPLQLDIFTNGQVMHADSAKILNEFQAIEPNVIKTIRARLTSTLEERFNSLAESVQSEQALAFKFDTDSILAKAKNVSASTLSLLSGITAKFNLSYLQYVKSADFFNAQVASTICIENRCLENDTKTSAISYKDLKTVGPADAGIVVYDSFLQNFVNSSVFQARLRTFFQTISSDPGTELGKDGIRVHLNPSNQSLDIILNLNIDMNAVAKADPSWSSRFTTSLGAAYEKHFGVGKIVKVPVQIMAKWGGFKHQIGANGVDEHFIALNTTLPFHADGTILNTYHADSNLDQVEPTIRKALLKKVQLKITKAIPAVIKIPLSSEEQFMVNGILLSPLKMVITPNGGLMFTGSVQ